MQEGPNCSRIPRVLCGTVMPCTGVKPRPCVSTIRHDRMRLQYFDVTSLYPYICKNFKFPVRHPIIQVGDACKDIEACLRMDGLIKCSIVSPEKLYHPALPFRCNNKLMFCLCRTCVLTISSNEECVHTRDENRAITGTWVMDEVRLAVEKSTGYSKYMSCVGIKLSNTAPKQARVDFLWTI